MRDVPAIADRQFGVFSAAQARDAGWTLHALRHAVDRDDLERLRTGVYAIPKPPETEPFAHIRLDVQRRATAFGLANPLVPISHLSAGALRGLELVDPPQHVCATYPRGTRGSMPGVHRHRGILGPGDVRELRGLLVTAPARTVMDIGHEHGADAGIAAADSALRRGATTWDELQLLIEATAHWPGIGPAHHAATLADRRAESALESISRLRIADARLPLPEPQVVVRSADGNHIGRVDFYWDEFGVVGEADGLLKLDLDLHGLRKEKVRQGRLEDSGLIVVRWGWRDLYDFAPVATRLRAAFARGLRPDRAPRLFTTLGWPYTRAAS